MFQKSVNMTLFTDSYTLTFSLPESQCVSPLWTGFYTQTFIGKRIFMLNVSSLNFNRIALLSYKYFLTKYSL